MKISEQFLARFSKRAVFEKTRKKDAMHFFLIQKTSQGLPRLLFYRISSNEIILILEIVRFFQGQHLNLINLMDI